MKRRLKRRSEDWRQKLPRPIVVKGGKTLRLLADCRRYVLHLDQFEAALVPWQHATQLMLTAAEGGSLEEVVLQFERVLVHQNKLVLQGVRPAEASNTPPYRRQRREDVRGRVQVGFGGHGVEATNLAPQLGQLESLDQDAESEGARVHAHTRRDILAGESDVFDYAGPLPHPPRDRVKDCDSKARLSSLYAPHVVAWS
jgi:hypothetical protein